MIRRVGRTRKLDETKKVSETNIKSSYQWFILFDFWSKGSNNIQKSKKKSFWTAKNLKFHELYTFLTIK